MHPTDLQLVQRCQQELPYVTTAFEILLRRYEPIVQSTCRRYLRGEQDAEEAAQDAFLRAFHALPSFEQRAAFRTWLFRIVANVCASRYARQKKQRLEQANLIVSLTDELPSDDRPLPDELDEVRGVIGEGLEMLSADDRQILILRHISGLPFQELAQTMELSLSAAKMRLYRAEQRLRIAYEQASK